MRKFIGMFLFPLYFKPKPDDALVILSGLDCLRTEMQKRFLFRIVSP